MENSRIAATTTRIPLDKNAETAVTFEVTPPEHQDAAPDADLIFVMDTSGSMSGSWNNQSKAAVCKSINDLADKGALPETIHIMEFNTFTKVRTFKGATIDVICNHVNRIQTAGCTDFVKMFQTLELTLLRSNNKDFRIVLNSDGVHYPGQRASPNDAVKALLKVQRTIAEKGFNVEWHVLGFNPEHDAKLLTQIAGTAGTFQYVAGASAISGCVQNLNDVLAQNTMRFEVNGQRVKLFAEERDGMQVLIGHLFLTQSSESYATMLSFGNTVENNTVYPVQQDADLTSPSFNKLASAWIASKIAIQTRLVANCDRNSVVLGAAAEISHSLRQFLVELRDAAMKLRARMTRKTLMESIEESNALINQFFTILAAAERGNISNEALAKMTAAAQKGNLKAGLQRKQDQRAATNVTRFSTLETELMKLIKQDRFKEANLTEKYGLLEEFSNCILSTSAWYELVEEGDALCLAVHITERPAAAIADSGRVQLITGVSLCAASSFYDGAIHALTINPSQHGGFGKHLNEFNAGLITGEGRECFSGVIPLYICPEHWEVSKFWMRQMVGFIATTDPFGYTFDQMTNIPFKLLFNIMNDDLSEGKEHNRRHFRWILDVCTHLMRDFSVDPENSFAATVVEKFTNFMKAAEFRTSEHIQNLDVFVTQVWVAIQENHIEADMNRFIHYLAEEVLRRNTTLFMDFTGEPRALIASEVNTKLISLLGIDMQRYVDIHVAAFKANRPTGENSGAQGYRDLMLCNLINKGVATAADGKVGQSPGVQPVMVEEIKIFQPEDEFDGSCPSIEPATYLDMEKWETIHLNKEFMPMLHVLSLKPDCTTNPLKWNLPKGINLLTLAIQNAELKATSACRAASQKCKIVDYTDDNACRTFLRNHCLEIVHTARSAAESRILDLEHANATGASVQIFLATDDLITAAGSAQHYLGRNLTAFIRALETHDNIPLIREKITMLISGQFRGVAIRPDYGIWNISKHHAFRIIRRRIKMFTDAEWAAIIHRNDKSYWVSGWRYNEENHPKAHLNAVEMGY